MKKILLLYILMASAIFSFAQTSIATPRPIALSAGDHLVKAGNNFIAGTIIVIAGVGISSLINAGSNDEDQKKMGTYLAGAAAFIGLICEISAASHLCQAGKILNDKKIGLSFNQNGVGIKFRLNKS